MKKKKLAGKFKRIVTKEKYVNMYELQHVAKLLRKKFIKQEMKQKGNSDLVLI